ncbi:ComF family protein [Sphaerisporangium rubeum]|uniref:Putative amidophosphoribosyltransferase n=1 Tax=Sphaerisporangium rubeum TaxID=321317 RepID=A0A7X0IEA4_9ACTN|nr:putative amidophosphoribosyltransferase [Sphaerisporangium rubeum]
MCSVCAEELHADPAPRPPVPAPRGMPECWSAAPYRGAARGLVLAYKERGRTALIRPLADVLATVLLSVPALPTGPLTLVPVPSARSAVRRRGHDPVARLAAATAARLRTLGLPASCTPALRHHRRVRDQAGLTATERAANLSNAFAVRRRRPTRPPVTAVLVDDIVTTGTTLTEAATTLRRTGIPVPLAITLTATPRLRR